MSKFKTIRISTESHTTLREIGELIAKRKGESPMPMDMLIAKLLDEAGRVQDVLDHATAMRVQDGEDAVKAITACLVTQALGLALAAEAKRITANNGDLNELDALKHWSSLPAERRLQYINSANIRVQAVTNTPPLSVVGNLPAAKALATMVETPDSDGTVNQRIRAIIAEQNQRIQEALDADKYTDEEIKAVLEA